MPDKTYIINEIFYSLQGEGVRCGNLGAMPGAPSLARGDGHAACLETCSESRL